MRGILSVAAVAVFSSSALAGFTQVGKVPVGEHSQERILQTLYGGDFVRNETDFFNGTVTVRRVDDGMTSTPAMSMAFGTIGDTTDEVWAGSMFSIKAVAKFSLNTQNLSISDGVNTTALFGATGYGYDVTGSASYNATGKNVHFIRSGDSGTQSSIVADNLDGRDHMITYEVLGLNTNAKVWVMFWEDLDRSPSLAKNRTHSDYNDLVVEMRAVPVPLPAAVWAGGALVASTAVFGKRIRRMVGA